MKRRIRRFAPILLGLGIVVATFVFILPKVADYGEVWDVVRDLTWPQIALLVGATVLNLATYAPPWMAALPGLSFIRAFVMTQASTASTYIAPGGAAVGMALSFAMLRRWAFRASDVALAVAVTGVWNQFVLLGFPVIALALLTLTGAQSALLQTVALVALALFVGGVAAFAAGLSTRRLARWLGDLAARVVSWLFRVVRRRPVAWTGESLVAFRDQALGLLGRRWHMITIATLAGQLTVFVLFFVCLRVVGVSPGEVSAIEAFAAWSLARLLGSIPITPGGIGIVEVGLTTALVGFGGNNAEVVAAVLVYRTLSMLPTLLLGLIAAAVWRRLEPRPPAQTLAAKPY
jgi:putative heme transporter